MQQKPQGAPENELPDSGQKDSEFFLICTPGLEDIVALELRAWLGSEPLSKVEKGGLTVFLPLEQGLQLNRVLKTPTRILLRLVRFGCRDFPKLFRKVSGFPWESWLSDDQHVEFQVATHGSWLKIKKRIEETARDGYRARLKKRGVALAPSRGRQAEPSLKVPIDVFVRLDDDLCTLSLDTSGELLHKRGAKPLVAEAPLRETLAASLLLLMSMSASSSTPNSSSMGSPAHTGKIDLVDPMTGGGTFLLEAAGLAQVVAARSFSFERFVMPGKNRSMQASQAILTPKGNLPQFAELIGFESDTRAIAAARENLRLLGRDATLFEQDFFATLPLSKSVNPRWLVANPPYGERLKIQGRLADFYEELFLQAERVASPERACFLLPEKVNPGRLQYPKSWRIIEQRRFSNGGLPVVAMVFERR